MRYLEMPETPQAKILRVLDEINASLKALVELSEDSKTADSKGPVPRKRVLTPRV